MIGHIPSILYFDSWINSVVTFDFYWGCGSRWAVAVAMRYHQTGCVIGISTLALPSCAVSPTIASLVRVWFSPVSRVISSASRSGGTMPLDGLLGLLCVKGDMGSPERYLKVCLFYCRH